MDPWQMAQQIKHELEQVIWHNSGDLVFGINGSVAVFAGPPTADQIPEGMPGALVLIGDYDSDDDHPDILTQQFQVMVAAEVAGDSMGEFSIIGGATDDLDESAGRGTHELTERVRAVLNKMTAEDGFNIKLDGGGGGGATPLGEGRHVAYASVSLVGVCTELLFYAEPQQFQYTGGSTTWTWEGQHCKERFDFKQFRMGYSNTAAPETPANLDVIVYTGSNLTATHTQLGSKFYAVFADYSSRKHASGSFQVEGSSSGTRVGAAVAT